MDLTKKFEAHCKVVVFQLESPEADTPYIHFQVYFELKKTNRLSWLKKHIHNTAHFEPAYGDQASNYKYCTKDETRLLGPWTVGIDAGSAKKVKANAVKAYVDAIRAGATDTDLWTDFPSCMARLSNVPARLRSLTKPKRCDLYPNLGPLPEVHVYFGEPGTGKSRAAREKYPDIYCLPAQRAGCLFLTSAGHLAPVVLLDDFAGDIPLKSLNILLDPYPIELEVKGAHLWYCPHTIIITTNIAPTDWYCMDRRQNVVKQVLRRITWIYDFNLKNPEFHPESVTEFEARINGENENPNWLIAKSSMSIKPLVPTPSVKSPFKSPLKRGIPLDPAEVAVAFAGESTCTTEVFNMSTTEEIIEVSSESSMAYTMARSETASDEEYGWSTPPKE